MDGGISYVEVEVEVCGEEAISATSGNSALETYLLDK